MLLVKGPRQSGKSTACALAARLDKNVVVVVASEMRRDYMLSLGVPKEQVTTAYSATTFLQGLRVTGRINDPELIIDDLGDVVTALFNRRVRFATITAEEMDL